MYPNKLLSVRVGRDHTAESAGSQHRIIVLLTISWTAVSSFVFLFALFSLFISRNFKCFKTFRNILNHNVQMPQSRDNASYEFTPKLLIASFAARSRRCYRSQSNTYSEDGREIHVDTTLWLASPSFPVNRTETSQLVSSYISSWVKWIIFMSLSFLSKKRNARRKRENEMF